MKKKYKTLKKKIKEAIKYYDSLDTNYPEDDHVNIACLLQNIRRLVK